MKNETYSFPGLLDVKSCQVKLHGMEKRCSVYKKLKNLFLFAWILFLVIDSVIFFGQLIDFSTGFIWLLVFFLLTLLFFMLFKSLSKERTKLTLIFNALNYTVNINSQYSAFIEQGFEKKEAYRLTIEWIDRQNRINRKENAKVYATYGMIDIAEINRISD